MSNVIAINANSSHSFALCDDGSVWAWGQNSNGELGDGATINRNVPVKLPYQNVLNFGPGGQASIFLLNGGHLGACGKNQYGQLGIGEEDEDLHLWAEWLMPDGGLFSIFQDHDQDGRDDVLNDNCPSSYNPDQSDLDGDGVPDACETCPDLDGQDQTDTDGDGAGDLCEDCPFDYFKTTPGLTKCGVMDPTLVAGNGHSLASDSFGRIWVFGENEYGQLGTGNTINIDSPAQILTQYVSEVIDVSGNGDHSLALLKDGTVLAWGYNIRGQLGDGTNENQDSPTPVSGVLSNVTAIAAGKFHSLALRGDGSVWTWGYNWSGQLGDGTQIDSNIPVKTMRLPSNIIAISAGKGHSLALTKQGDVWGWGQNSYGQLGSGDLNTQVIPVQAHKTLSNIIAIEAGSIHSMALDADGGVWTWGRNFYGELGDGGSEGGYMPCKLQSLPPIKVIAAGDYFSMALGRDGTLWAWGDNEFGQLGDETTVNKTSPVQVLGVGKVAAMACGNKHALILCSDGALKSLGKNEFGQLGIGSMDEDAHETPESVQSVGEDLYLFMDEDQDGRADLFDNCAGVCSPEQIDSDEDGKGDLCDSCPLDRPKILPGKTGCSTPDPMICAGQSHAMAVDREGNPWAWGYNSFGQLGNKSFEDAYNPILISSSLSNINYIAAGEYYSLAVTQDGSVWAWGANGEGQLGDGSTTTSYSPKRLDCPPEVKSVAAGQHHSLCLLYNGDVYSWGFNDNWELGRLEYDSYITPQKSHYLQGAQAIAAGESHSLALLNNGKVMAWGASTYGQVGWGGISARKWPVDVLNLTKITKIASRKNHSLALKNDGTVWAWGQNTYGQLGVGSQDSYKTKSEQVLGLTSITDIACGDYHSLAVQSNGTAWAWGRNYERQLGNDNPTIRYTPVKIQGVTDAIAVAGGQYFSLILRADGSIVAFGRNTYGQLGIGSWDSSYHSVPETVLDTQDKSFSIFSDIDLDGLDDVVFDNCPETYNPTQSDTDTDGAGDACDNCLFTPNPGQEDENLDGIGDACPGKGGGDLNGDGEADLMDAIRCLQIVSNNDPGGSIVRDNALRDDGVFGTDEATCILRKLAE